MRGILVLDSSWHFPSMEFQVFCLKFLI